MREDVLTFSRAGRSGRPDNCESSSRGPSTPFWLIGTVTEQFLPKEMPIELPVSWLIKARAMNSGLSSERSHSGGPGGFYHRRWSSFRGAGQ